MWLPVYLSGVKDCEKITSLHLFAPESFPHRDLCLDIVQLAVGVCYWTDCYFSFLAKLAKRVMLERMLPASLRLLSRFLASFSTCFMTESFSLQVT
jgi:hypothetical protein